MTFHETHLVQTDVQNTKNDNLQRTLACTVEHTLPAANLFSLAHQTDFNPILTSI